MASSGPVDFTVESVVRGHHIYKQVWTPVVGEELTLAREYHNLYDCYATTVNKDAAIVGRVPRELSKLFWNFLASGGLITCEVTGRRRKGKGLEVPCTYKLQGDEKLVSKLKKTLKEKPLLSAAVHTHSCPY